MPSINHSIRDLLSELKEDLKSFEMTLGEIAIDASAPDQREKSLDIACRSFHDVFQSKLILINAILDTEDNVAELVKHQKLQDLLYS